MKIQNNKYIVKDVLQFKIQDGQEYFLVWWQGFKRDEATWEPMKNMIFLKDYQDYYNNLRQKYLLQKQKNKSIKFSSPLVRKTNRQRLLHQELQIEHKVNKPTRIQRKVKIINKKYPISSLRSSQLQKTFQQAILQPNQINTPISLKVSSKSRKQKIKKQNTSNNHNTKIQTQNQKQDESVQPIQQKSERKKTITFTINSQLSNANNNVNLLSQNNNLKGSIIQKINLNSNSPISNMKSPVDDKKFLKAHLKPMQFEVRVKESKSIPLWDQQIKNIKGAFYKDEQMMYQVQFENNKCNLPIIVHQEYLKLLWPKKYYEYLCTKVTE